MSTNLSGTTLTLGNTSLTENTLKVLSKQYYVPSNFNIGDTVWLDGIECIVIAKDITIQGCSYRNIAVDKNHDLGWYCKYIGDTWGTKKVSQVTHWIWGGFGTITGSTSEEVGYGYQNTINYLANSYNGTNGTNGDSTEDHTEYPSLYRGLNDFRNVHSDKWFLPSMNEFDLLQYNEVISDDIFMLMNFDSSTGAPNPSEGTFFWSSSESTNNNAIRCNLRGVRSDDYKYYNNYVRLFRVF